MKNKFLLPLLVLVALLFGGLWQWLDSGTSDLADDSLVAMEIGEQPLEPVSGDLPMANSVTSREEGGAAPVPQSKAARKSMDETPENLAIPSNAVWISGRVIFPEGMPNEVGVVTITARGRTFGESSRREHEVKADRNGDFRVAFAKETRTGWLEASSRYLYTPEKLSIAPNKVTEPVILKPEMGGIIRGVAKAPMGENWDEQARDGAVVVVRSRIGRNTITRSAGFDKDGNFELRAVPPGDFRPRIRTPLWVDHREEKVSVRSGETIELQLQLQRGSVISGRVLDEDGIGCVGVGVELTSVGGGWSREFNLTDEEGAFVLRGVDEGEFVIKAAVQEMLVSEKELGFVAAGTTREGIELVVSTGNSIHGVVRWPDGSAAVGAWVSVSQEREVSGLTFNFDDSVSEKTGPDGTFELTGLEPSMCAVRVTAKSFREADVAKAKTREAAGKKPRLRARGPTYRVRKLDVPPGTRGLELILNPGDSITGRVLNDEGNGLKAFLIQATPDGDDLLGRDSVRRIVASLDGSFTVDGLREGVWNVRAIADDHEPSQEISVTLPGSGELEFTANRLAQLSGLVRDPSGEPLSGAGVWIDKLDDDDNDVLGTLIARSWGEQATSNRDGKFKARDVTPGRLKVWANADGFGASEPVVLQVEPGSNLEEVVLQLSLPGRIRGSLHGSIVEREERDIEVRVVGGGYVQGVKTDSRGDFTIEGLNAGQYRLRLSTKRAASEGSVLEREVIEIVDVAEGSEVTVVLGAPPSNPVTVEGIVRLKGEPAVGVAIRCRASEGGELNNDVSRTGSNGEYVMTLSGPGEFVFTLGGKSTGLIRQTRELGPGENLQVDFDLPSASLSGVVLGLNGEGLAKCDLKLIPVTQEEGGTAVEQVAETGENGAFEFLYVAEGTYNLRVNGRRISYWQRRRSSKTFPGARMIEGLRVVEGEPSAPLDIQLLEEGSLNATVTDSAGTPVKGASLVVRTEAGAELHDGSREASNSAGKVTYDGIGIERITVEARRNGMSGPRVAARVIPGESTDVFIELNSE